MPKPEVAPNPDAPNTVDAVGAEVAGEAAGCPNTVLVGAAAAVVTLVVTAAAAASLLVTVTVVAAGATVLMTGVTFRELLSVVGGEGCVNMEPGFSEATSWNASGGA